jgi:hypothetical protein
LEKENLSNLFVANLTHKTMSMDTYERTNCVRVCRPCIKRERATHSQNIKEELVLLLLKCVSHIEKMEFCTVICGNGQ